MDRNRNDLAEWLKRAKSWQTSREEFDIVVTEWQGGKRVESRITGKEIVREVNKLG